MEKSSDPAKTIVHSLLSRRCSSQPAHYANIAFVVKLLKAWANMFDIASYHAAAHGGHTALLVTILSNLYEITTLLSKLEGIPLLLKSELIEVPKNKSRG